MKENKWKNSKQVYWILIPKVIYKTVKRRKNLKTNNNEQSSKNH